ncbi:MAG TPA: MotA/TolQ/ExbB proton channel family protein [Caulobacteraceae bacterium]|nr:MotA/TolQ/ExbB proton channel family protein [Caulobacteraceae bacterium]
MINKKTITPFIGVLGAMALMVSAPAFAQPAANAPAADAAAAPTAATNAPAAADEAAPPTLDSTMKKGSGKLTVAKMFADATAIPKTVMIALMLASVLTWILAILKIFEFGSLNRSTNRFLEAFRQAKSIPEMGKIAMSDEHAGNPLADMTAAAAHEIQLSQQAGLQVAGEHRETTIGRATAAVGGIQAQLAKRLSSSMQIFATTGAISPFVGLFGTVVGIMNSFINIANTSTTNLAVVAPGIAEALLATAIGLFAAIPAVMFYNNFQSQITGYGTRTEGFVAELMNNISRQLDRGA